MLYFWITNAVKKSRSPPGSVPGSGFFFGGSIAGSEKQKSLSLMSLNSAVKHSTSMSAAAAGTSTSSTTLSSTTPSHDSHQGPILQNFFPLLAASIKYNWQIVLQDFRRLISLQLSKDELMNWCKSITVPQFMKQILEGNLQQSFVEELPCTFF